MSLQMSALKCPAVDEVSDVVLKRNLKTIAKKLPTDLGMQSLSTPKKNGDSTPDSSTASVPPHRSQSSGKLRNLADRGFYSTLSHCPRSNPHPLCSVQSVASKGHQRLMQNPNSPFNKGSGLKIHPSASSSSFPEAIIQNGQQYNGGNAFDGEVPQSPSEVLVFSLIDDRGQVPIGMCSEESVIEAALTSKTERRNSDKKQTRFTTASESVGMWSDFRGGTK